MKKVLISILLPFFLSTVYAEVPILDNATTSIVKQKMATDPLLARSNVTVTTNNGIVKIEGTVATENEASLLIQTAQSASGVKDVDASNLKVIQSQQVFADMVITAKIKGLLLQAKIFNENDLRAATINVTTNNGIVSLSGVATTPQQVENAIRIAKSVAGVQVVESLIKVVR